MAHDNFSHRRGIACVLLIAAAALLSGCGGGGGGIVQSSGIRVACVGDSITYGAGISDPSERYPARLAALLGSGYSVGNFGYAGATLITSGDLPYQATDAFEQSRADSPNIVVIMLGTNDAEPVNWVHEGDFEPDYLALIAQYRALPTHPEVFVCLPPPVYGGGPQSADLQGGVLPDVRRVAAQAGCPLIDNNAPLQNHPEWFSDSIHPDAEGANVIAEDVDAAIPPPPAP